MFHKKLLLSLLRTNFILAGLSFVLPISVSLVDCSSMMVGLLVYGSQTCSVLAIVSAQGLRRQSLS